MPDPFDRATYDALRFALDVDNLLNKLGYSDDGMCRDVFASIALDGFDIDRNEARLFVSAYDFALRKDTPAKAWWEAFETDCAPVYRALRIDPSDQFACYAVMPFRIVRNGDGHWRIWAAHPCPRFLAVDSSGLPDMDWLGIETIIEWNPIDDTAHIVGDPAPQLVGNLTVDANQIHASPRAFFQAWAIRRAQFAQLRQNASAKRWHVVPAERDEVPGALLIGDIGKVRLSPSMMPEHIETFGIDPKVLNRAIMRAAKLPRVSAKASPMRRAA